MATATTITKPRSRRTFALAGCRTSRSTKRGAVSSPTARSRASTSSSRRPARPSWLVDVKGRRFPSGDEHHQYWKNWSTRDDLRSLAAWQTHFGARLLPDARVRLPPRRPAGRRCRASSCSSSAASTTASSASGWPTTCRTPGRSPTAGTRWRCPPACSAAPPGRSTTGSAGSLLAGTVRRADWQELPAILEWEA